MRRICRIAIGVFAIVYVLALVLLLIGMFGLFGAERDPLAGVFLIPLGLPWNLMHDGFPDAALPWLAAAAPLLNIAVLALLCRAVGRRRE